MEDTPIVDTGAEEFALAEEPAVNIEEQVQQPKPVEPTRSAAFEIDGKQYSITEEQVRKYYGIPATEEITDKEWKTFISNYKTNIHYNKKNHETSTIKRQVEDAFRKLYEDPKTTLKTMFKEDPARLKATLEEMLLEDIEYEMMPEEQRQLLQAKKELEELKRLQQEQDEIRRRVEMEALEEHYQQEIESNIIQALEMGDLPKTPATVRRIAYYLLQGIQRGFDLQPKDVLSLVREDYEIEVKELLGGADPKLIAQLLGENKIKELRNSDIQRVKNNLVQQRNVIPEDEPPVYREQRKESWQDAREKARQRIQKLKQNMI